MEPINPDYSENRNILSIVGNLHVGLQDFASMFIVPKHEKEIYRIVDKYPILDCPDFYMYLYSYHLDDYEITYWKEKGVSDNALEEIQDIKNDIYNELTNILIKVIKKF